MFFLFLTMWRYTSDCWKIFNIYPEKRTCSVSSWRCLGIRLTAGRSSILTLKSRLVPFFLDDIEVHIRLLEDLRFLPWKADLFRFFLTMLRYTSDCWNIFNSYPEKRICSVSSWRCWGTHKTAGRSQILTLKSGFVPFLLDDVEVHVGLLEDFQLLHVPLLVFLCLVQVFLGKEHYVITVNSNMTWLFSHISQRTRTPVY